jgi:hypothetical protein
MGGHCAVGVAYPRVENVKTQPLLNASGGHAPTTDVHPGKCTHGRWVHNLPTGLQGIYSKVGLL